MVTPTQTLDIKSVERFLEVRGFERSVNYGGEVSYISADSEWAVELNGTDSVSLCKFTDGDIDGVAVGRYETAGDECSTLDELKAEMYSVGALPFECPNCGDAGGEPRTATSEPYLYGADADGNRGEMRTETFEGCSKCIKTYWRD
jgi:hypothetical protein